jgi:hypothetical protein
MQEVLRKWKHAVLGHQIHSTPSLPPLSNLRSARHNGNIRPSRTQLQGETCISSLDPRKRDTCQCICTTLPSLLLFSTRLCSSLPCATYMHEASTTLGIGWQIPRPVEQVQDVQVVKVRLVMHPGLSILTSAANVGAAHRGCAGWW